MGFMTGTGDCVSCGRLIPVFSPSYVPSLRVNGEREPLCEACFHKWNHIHRTSKGLDPLPLHPDAYKPEETDL